MKSQEDVFVAGEGDRFYTRNRESLLDARRVLTDPALALLTKARVRPRRVLDLGASNGWRAAAIHARYDAHCTAVDPSREAIREGRATYPKVRFRRGVVDRVPLPPGELFDLVLVYFVLHWVSREALLRCVTEIDARLAPGGYLLLGDFLPTVPTRVPYGHLPGAGLYTFKLNYPELFLSTGVYRLVQRVVFDHATGRPRRHIPDQDRAVCALLQKVGGQGYTRRTLVRV